ncbi:hypothetical protein PIB30_016605 [Stylosanthes scabra]|uniref:Uncharacterized protein n=1 Tax=Stylosanthes scabra TaxID=79078 RepID=A0ABU6T873_9FABA|nr:hypothetical protein [Stylosanthes scabra]
MKTHAKKAKLQRPSNETGKPQTDLSTSSSISTIFYSNLTDSLNVTAKLSIEDEHRETAGASFANSWATLLESWYPSNQITSRRQHLPSAFDTPSAIDSEFQYVGTEFTQTMAKAGLNTSWYVIGPEIDGLIKHFKFKRMPCSALVPWPNNVYRFPIDAQQEIYVVPDSLKRKLDRDSVREMWFIDNADNCVEIGMRRQGQDIIIEGAYVSRFRSYSQESNWAGIEVHYFKWGVFSAQVKTWDMKFLKPRSVRNLYAGRVLPSDIKDEIKRFFGVEFNDDRELLIRQDVNAGNLMGAEDSVCTTEISSGKPQQWQGAYRGGYYYIPKGSHRVMRRRWRNQG